MSIGKSLLPEFDSEMAGTRKVLERIPDEKMHWRAHEKSNTIGWVANLLADIPIWVKSTLGRDSWDIHPVGGKPYQSPQFETRSEILNLFDSNVAAAHSQLTNSPDEEFSKPWSLLLEGKELVTMPKREVIRTWVLNHSIHHRAILCVYLRLNDIPVPTLYGPSGDEEAF